MNSLGYIHREGGSSKGPKTARDRVARGIAMPCVYGPRWNPWTGPDADAGHAAPGARRLSRPAGFPAAPDAGSHRQSATRSRQPICGRPIPTRRAPSRIGQIPTYGLPAASGASESGYDSLNRKRKKPKYYPGQAKPKPPPGPGTPAPTVVANPNARVRLSVPPSELANKTPIPPAMAGTVVGQPTRKRLKVDDDPFGAVGDYAGSFLIKGAIETSAGYDTNPGRLATPQGSAGLCGRAGIACGLGLGAPRGRC